MKCGLVSVQGWPLNTGKNSKERHRTATGWPRTPPPNRGGRLIWTVTNTAFVSADNRKYENWPLNSGWNRLIHSCYIQD